MIRHVHIENFKSIKELDLDLKRVNIIIGEPNSGKSNILEAFGLLSWLQQRGNLNEFVRHEHINELFHLKKYKPIKINIDKDTINAINLEFYSENAINLKFYSEHKIIKSESLSLLGEYVIEIPEGARFQESNPKYKSHGDWNEMLSDKCYNPTVITVPVGSIVTWVNKDTVSHRVIYAENPLDKGTWRLYGDILSGTKFIMPNESVSWTFKEQGEYPYICPDHPWMIGKVKVVGYESYYTKFMFYRFKLIQYNVKEGEVLLPPHGKNLMWILKYNGRVRETLQDILKQYGLKLLLTEDSVRIILREHEGIVEEISYNMLSDGLQRIIFYTAAILSNENSVILLEEPEAHIFPSFTHELADMIISNDSNQYIITTHNPYFLIKLVEKCKRDDINVIVTQMNEGVTTAKVLTEEDLQKILEYDIDIFFNLSKFLE
jgi:AAA15 family ATPase/GTPase